MNAGQSLARATWAVVWMDSLAWLRLGCCRWRGVIRGPISSNQGPARKRDKKNKPISCRPLISIAQRDELLQKT